MRWVPTQPFRNQGPWSTPPSTRPAPVGTPPLTLQKKSFFFFFVRVRNDKNTTHVAKFAPSLGPVPLPRTPPEPKPLHPPPSPCPASLTPASDAVRTHPAFPRHDPFPWNQGPWSTPPSTRPAPVGPPPTPQGILQKKPTANRCSRRAAALRASRAALLGIDFKGRTACIAQYKEGCQYTRLQMKGSSVGFLSGRK